MSPRFSTLAICFAALHCNGLQRPVQHSSTNWAIATPTPLGQKPAGQILRPVRVELLDCEIVQPVTFEETLPDGRMVESTGGRGATSVRLYLRLENPTDRQLLATTWNGALVIKRHRIPEPFNDPATSGDWKSLPSGGAIVVYPTVPRQRPENGTFTEKLTLELGDPPDPSWYPFSPDSVSFELTSAGCRPLEAQQ